MDDASHVVAPLKEQSRSDRPATEADFQAFREGEIEVTETSEQPMVSKEARVVEEVRLTKDVEQRDEVVRDTVRKTDVDVEKLNDESTKSRDKNAKIVTLAVQEGKGGEI